MWHGFDPEIQKQLATIKELTGLRHKTPTKEWPLMFVPEHDAMLVVREWPDGEITAYLTSDHLDSNQGK
jgi:hypothetical protein